MFVNVFPRMARGVFAIVFMGLLISASPAKAQESALSPQGVFIQNLGDQAIEILKNKALTPEDRKAAFRVLLVKTFDLETIARFVLGRSWLAAKPEQKKQYLDLFEQLVVKTYADRFSLYTGEGFKVVGSTPEGSKDTVVKSEITTPDGVRQTEVSWRVRQGKDGKPGIIDVVVEGVSMSVTQRQEYASIIERNGGDLNPLLDMMRARVNRGEGVKEK